MNNKSSSPISLCSIFWIVHGTEVPLQVFVLFLLKGLGFITFPVHPWNAFSVPHCSFHRCFQGRSVFRFFDVSWFKAFYISRPSVKSRLHLQKADREPSHWKSLTSVLKSDVKEISGCNFISYVDHGKDNLFNCVFIYIINEK